MDERATPAVSQEQSQADVSAPVPKRAVPPSEEANDNRHQAASSPAAASVRLSAGPGLTWRRLLLAGALVIGLGAAAYWLFPLAHVALTTVSTDDAYVNGHVTFVAPR